MSDFPPLELLDSYLQWKLSIESTSLAYPVEPTKNGALLDLNIPYPRLKAWHSLVVIKKTISPSCETPMVPLLLGQLTFTELLEHSIPGNSFVQ